MLALVWVAAVGGTLIGDTASYAVGRWGSGLVATSPRFAPAMRLGRALVTGRTMWMIPLYHLHSISRAVGPFGAGAVRMPLRWFLPLDYLGAIVANTVWVGGGAILGTTVLTPEGKLEEHPVLRIGLGLGAAAWFIVMQRLVSRRMAELARLDEAEHGTAEDDPGAAEEAEREPALRR
jgi:membrane protein DedA with SNARE-associated domain